MDWDGSHENWRFATRTGIVLAPRLTMTETRIRFVVAPTGEIFTQAPRLKLLEKAQYIRGPQSQKRVKNGLQCPGNGILKNGLHVFSVVCSVSN
jgi:hypothetical protein